jgi:uncharacterized protein with ParB-like and HNH nuclease domain
MAESNLLDTKTVSLGEIFGNGKIYRVPPFQRDYSWEEDQWDDLWTDVLNIHQTGSQHYMGAVVLQSTDKKQFWIIDGQQRFTTVSLLILAVIQKIRQLIENREETSQNQERVELLMSRYIGQKDPVSLRYGSKLYLNQNNDFFFQSRLVQFKPPVLAGKLNDSEKMLWKAYQFFQMRLDELYGDHPSGESLAKFLDQSVADRLMFIQIIVENELNAYTVFETLNARGVELTSTDLLKNYLFSLVARIESHIEQVKTQWKIITDIIGLKDLPVYLRHFLNSRHELVAKDNLFKVIKQEVRTEEQVFALLDDLERNAFIYKALGNPTDELWKEDKEIAPLISALKLFRVIQFKPLLLVAYEQLEAKEFKRLLKDIVHISFRYNVVAKRNAKDMERAFHKAAIGVFGQQMVTARDIYLKALSGIYISDKDFKNDFSTLTVNTNRDKRLARYMLYHLERQAGGSNYDYESDEGSIEHILPEGSLTTVWDTHFSEEEHCKLVFSLGNLTLLETKLNRKLSNQPFQIKMETYPKSQYALTQQVKASEWTPTAIEHRQAGLAKMAAEIWKVHHPVLILKKSN